MTAIVLDTEFVSGSGLMSIGWVIVQDSAVVNSEYLEVAVTFDVPWYINKLTGLTKAKLAKSGKPVAEVLEVFHEALKSADIMVAHNLTADMKILLAESEGCGMGALTKLLSECASYCTFRQGCDELKMKKGRGQRKMGALHRYLFGCNFKAAHSALEDAYACARCYVKIKDDVDMDGDIDYVVSIKPLPPASDQQRAVVDAAADSNVLVDAVSGSGKTTTCVHIAQKYEGDNILMISYNKALAVETNTRLEDYGISNMMAYTIHGFISAKYGKVVRNDTALDQSMMRPPAKSFKYDRVIIDEAQDLRTLFFRAISKIIGDNEGEPLICVLGDTHQCIYGYMGADARFLSLADKLIGGEAPWVRLELSETFRMTPEMAAFVNGAMLYGDQRFTSNQPSGPKPIYIRANPWDQSMFGLIHHVIKENGYGPRDIFVLGRSTNGNTPIKELANAFSKHTDMPVYLQTRDSAKGVVDSLVANKVIMCSGHQSKGCERPFVIVYDFDGGMYGADELKEATAMIAPPCLNISYVMATRAKRNLILISNAKRAALPFLGEMKGLAEVVDISSGKVSEGSAAITKTLDQIISHLPEDKVALLLELIEVDEAKQLSDIVCDIPFTTQQKYNGVDIEESVGDYSTAALSSIYSYQVMGATPEWVDALATTDHELARDWTIELAEMKEPTTEHLLKGAAILYSIHQGVVHRLAQISEYNWLTPIIVGAALSQYKSLELSDDIHFHSLMERVVNDRITIKLIGGIIDDNTKRLYSVIVKSEMDDIDIIRAAATEWVFDDDSYSSAIYNLRMGSIVSIKLTDPDKFISVLMSESPLPDLSDAEFIEANYIRRCDE
jgi:DNA polymerase III epsilon subunit-like protein